LHVLHLNSEYAGQYLNNPVSNGKIPTYAHAGPQVDAYTINATPTKTLIDPSTFPTFYNSFNTPNV
jgi:hypothetical protein